ncbi:MAG: hypothetical protein CBC12_05505 [Candidatus Puniceispirillum sp. TMED52]|nr:MAG: hypothetical protein CBC12_05505 [Candidatus Puniceispirillum sp. TMED52]|tara:strand:- start:3078 stop:3647 length:570 start_codon:yes stop_codon:yes gene_type:complete
MIVDLFLVYQFIRRLATPFKEWKAYELGIIDDKGVQLKKRREFTTREEKDAYGIFDIMITKLKRLIEKVPGGKTRLGSYAAALYLIKEHNDIMENGEMLTEEHLELKLNEYMTLVEDSQLGVDELFEKAFEEDAPANSAGGGNIAGIGVGSDGEPGLSVSQQKKYKKKNSPVVKRFKDRVTLLGSNDKG